MPQIIKNCLVIVLNGIKNSIFYLKKPNATPEAFNICKESIKNKDIYLF